MSRLPGARCLAVSAPMPTPAPVITILFATNELPVLIFSIPYKAGLLAFEDQKGAPRIERLALLDATRGWPIGNQSDGTKSGALGISLEWRAPSAPSYLPHVW